MAFGKIVGASLQLAGSAAVVVGGGVAFIAAHGIP